MRLPVPGPRDVMSALERGSEQVEALLGAVPRVLALLDQAEALSRVSVASTASAVATQRRRGGRVERWDGDGRRRRSVVGCAVGRVDWSRARPDRAGGSWSTVRRADRRVGGVVDGASTQIERVGTVVDGASTQIDRVGTVVDGAAVQAGRAAALLDALEPPLTKLQPTLQTLADTTHPEEVAALVRLVDHLPALTDQVERDVLPVLTTLGSVAPDLHELLNVSRELNEILGKIPGIGRLKRRVEEDDDIETPR